MQQILSRIYQNENQASLQIEGIPRRPLEHYLITKKRIAQMVIQEMGALKYLHQVNSELIVLNL